MKTLRRKILGIPAIYGSGGRLPALRLGVQELSLCAKYVTGCVASTA
ncbi:MAG: hypothetical protein ACUVWX_05335 [Kiritimatiellia bacterium]